jgi:hypothetical protein
VGDVHDERPWLNPDLPWDVGDALRDSAFTPMNDAIWGPGQWIRCPSCPPDHEGRPPYHHKNAHQ